MLSSPLAALALKLLFTVLAVVLASRVADGTAIWRDAGAQRGLGGLLAGALFGSKLGFWAQYPGVWLAEIPSLWLAASGLSVPGACAGGALGLVLAARARAPALADALIAPVLAFLLVLDLGAVTWSLTEPGFGAAARRWGINFGDGIPRHPVMLYDAAALAAFWWAGQGAGVRVRGGRVGGEASGAAEATAGGAGSGATPAPGLVAAMVGAACFGLWFLLGFLKPPFGPVLLLEAIYPRPALYWPGLTGEQCLCLVAMLALAVFCLRPLRKTVPCE